MLFISVCEAPIFIKSGKKINADNADIIITADDLQMHINNLKSAPKGQNEIKNTSKEDLAKWVSGLKEKKK